MLDKLEDIKNRWKEVEKLMADPAVVADMKRFVQLSKEYKELKVIVDMLKIYKDVINNIAGSKDIIENEKDEEFREMAKGELEELTKKKSSLEEKIRIHVIIKNKKNNQGKIFFEYKNLDQLEKIIEVIKKNY